MAKDDELKKRQNMIRTMKILYRRPDVRSADSITIATYKVSPAKMLALFGRKKKD